MTAFRYRQEVYRKLIHLSSLWMPLAVYFLDKKIVLPVFAGGALVVLLYEVVRRQDHRLGRLLEKLTGAALRPGEKTGRFRPSGAVYVLLSAFLSTLLFPKMVAVTAMAMALTGDTAAALVGRKFGRTKMGGKSLEGSLAFFAAALATAALIATAVPAEAVPLRATVFGAAIAAITELASRKLPVDDNLSVPLAAGAAMLLA